MFFPSDRRDRTSRKQCRSPLRDAVFIPADVDRLRRLEAVNRFLGSCFGEDLNALVPSVEQM